MVIKNLFYICIMELLTATQIAERTKIPLTTVNRHLKKYSKSIVFVHVTKRIKQYNTATLPNFIKNKI